MHSNTKQCKRNKQRKRLVLFNPLRTVEKSNKKSDQLVSFIHHPFPTTAGGVGAYITNCLNVAINDNLSLNIRGCENLWITIDFPDLKNTLSLLYNAMLAITIMLSLIVLNKKCKFYKVKGRKL